MHVIKYCHKIKDYMENKISSKTRFANPKFITCKIENISYSRYTYKDIYICLK